MNIHSLNTKKSLGQHWLQDKDILQGIVDSAEIKAGDNVLEIGPGLGTLTEVLLNTKAEILSLEYDKDLIKGLERKFSNCKNFAIRFGDIRTFDFSKMPKNYKIVANIPYYLTSNLIRSISDSDNQPSLAVLLVQKEVAQRLCAEPGQMGILSVIAQYFFECKLDIEVSAKYFTPPPKVDSQVVLLTRRSEPLFDVDTAEYFKLVKAGFSGKRKTLRNSLSSGLNIPKTKSIELLGNAGIEDNLRAQQLSHLQWHNLYREFLEYK